MTRLILTADSSTAGALVGARADNLAIAIEASARLGGPAV